MKRRDADLIATVLGDRRPDAALSRWLATDEGARELAAYRRALGALRALHGAPRRVLAAPRSGQAPVYYASLPAPIGRVWVAVGDAGVLCVRFRQSEAAFVAELRRRLGVEPVRSAVRTAAAIRQLRAYFAGRRRRFALRVDLRLATPFARRVLAAAMRVPPGRVVSYGDIARRIGQPRGSRAVGQALGRNPIPIVVPCHRVVAAGGALGGYTGGLAIKRRLLRLEGVGAASV